MNALNLAIAAGPGRRAEPVQAEYLRDLEPDDLEKLATVPANSVPPQIKRITDRHHTLARLLAAGTSEEEAALITGYSNSRVSILKNSPAFKELLALYRAEAKAEFVTVYEHMAGLGRDALVVMRDRLEDDEDSFSNRELLQIVTELTDRTAQNDDDTSRAMPDIIELVAPAPKTGAPGE